MRILAIDTSGPVCGVAVTDGGRVLAEQTVLNSRTHSANLMPMTDRVLKDAGLSINEIERIACVTGPGSFTGVRIGVATVKGLSFGSGIPCVPVDALEALAVSAGAFDGVVCPIQDARCGQVYGAAFRDGERLTEDRALKLSEFIDLIAPLGEHFLFTGDGMPVHAAAIRELLGEKAAFAPAHLAYLRPSAAAVIAAGKTETVTDLELEAFYLRAPNAQLNKKLLEAMKNG
ncbi:MAG: tRNA (adenosine(37)-N6)-threonylcarbamoyltransferase complex dimerization subunit type 1 TsaB [Clostridia bacterium]|nr:tRNA (adenosine(37)-N6)-threonylcarbamoyltransferase complex dimerization subunit type 1 TsaB [Clostridia bacterium]